MNNSTTGTIPASLTFNKTAINERNIVKSRTSLIARIILAFIATLVMIGVQQTAIASAATPATSPAMSVLNYTQGTGPIDMKSPSTLNGVPVVSLSKDMGWSPSIKPVAGDRTMDESRIDGDVKLDDLIDEQLRDGAVMIGNNSYSLGSLVVADTLNARANAGKDNSKVMADIASDPAYSNTGILVVLEPLAPILGPTLGITPTGERHGDFGDANVVLRCWTFDLICDFKDPSRDLWGSINSGVGYLTEHGGMDPLQSYATSATDKAQATTVVDGNVTKVTYHGELPTIRAYELATGLTVSDDGKRIANALVLSKGNPGEVQSYKTPLEVMSEATGIEIPSQGVAMPEVEDLTKDMNAQFNSIVEPIRAEVEKAVEPLLQNTIAYTSNDTSYEATPAAYSAPAQVDYTPIVENTAVAATSLVDDAVSSNVIPADLGAQLNAGINNFAAQGLALLGGK